MMTRVTTNGVLKGYRTNLMKSSNVLNKARNTVLSQRNFNSYAEDPSSATQAFRLRRSFWRTESQISNSQSVINKYNTAYTALEGISETVFTTKNDGGTALKSALMGENGTTGSGRVPLGTEMISTAESIVQSMNAKYGDSFIFAGADGLNVPFSWDENGSICFRGVPVDCEVGSADYEKLKYMAGETVNVDLGMGLQEDEDGELIDGSAFNSALSGLDFLGFGVDEEGLPNNLASIINEMGKCLSRCNPDTGDWTPAEDKDTYEKLLNKLNESSDNFTTAHVKQSADATFLNTNLKQLEGTAYSLNEQINAIEKCDLADAITSFSWAQYCYNAALKVGNSILSESLIDYMR